eukprot:CAMPEP_0113943386 /NCGR_PEP_ID=MMETSP1339-20121228/23221_1 /TAXON_ID=94617 /ORGANISM="Fibrocapsa japonica" /LENGTH=820 /DNA_ID=CAMNT_0000948241 /DNA_START=97 /DNA_END=2559 /DNA_ORIENTATION=+ /assembly_acc=CAM_ASM_000762
MAFSMVVLRSKAFLAPSRVGLTRHAVKSAQSSSARQAVGAVAAISMIRGGGASDPSAWAECPVPYGPSALLLRQSGIRGGAGPLNLHAEINNWSQTEEDTEAVEQKRPAGEVPTFEGPLADNPLLQQSGLPKFSEVQPDHVVPAMTAILERLEEDLVLVEEALKRPTESEIWEEKRLYYSFDDVVSRMEKISSALSYAWGVVGHLNGVKNSEELREAYQEMQPKVVQASTRLGQSEQVYKALKQLSMKSHSRELDEAQQRIVEASLRSMTLSGVGLEGEEKERFNEIMVKNAELSTKFSNNVLDATKAFSLLLTTKEEVDGLPPSALALGAQQAAAKGNEGATPEEGPWLITLDIPSYMPAMQHLKSRQIREKLYRAFITRASSGETDNEPIIQEILKLRKEKSKMLGFENFAEMSLASKMAPNVGAVDELSNFLNEKALPAAKDELGELTEFAKANGFDEKLELWDVTFWSERRKEELLGFQEEELRPYFKLDAVLGGMFDLASRLFGVTIEKAAEGEVEVWHPDASFYNVKSVETCEQVASFYLDPYSRPAEKRGGAWMDVCVGRSKVMDKKPVAYLVCNGSPPVGDKPSLMTFREVETLFHEFGHGLQHMLTKIEYADAAGINNVEWDAVELPSQFMENWCYDEPTVYGFANHYETGEPLPKELFEKLKAQRTYGAGLMMTRQLNFGQLDMELHARYDPEDESKTVRDVQKEVAAKYSVLPPLDEDRFLCAFGHIFAGGYAAGYYSYKWAEVMSADAFGAFEEVGLHNEDKVREVGQRFRNTVLAMGGGRDPMQVFKDFRGREPSPEALLRHSGLAN